MNNNENFNTNVIVEKVPRGFISVRIIDQHKPFMLQNCSLI